MAKWYLYLNSLLYLYVAVRSTLAPQRTATDLGFLSLSDRGRAEYLVVYGGLQLGLALLFGLLARHPASTQLGLLIAAGFYAPIVLYRLVSAWQQWPLPGSALGTIALEIMLLVAALWLYHSYLTT